MTFILGLNAFHGDSAACLVVEGKLVSAAEEERFRRLKIAFLEAGAGWVPFEPTPGRVHLFGQAVTVLRGELV